MIGGTTAVVLAAWVALSIGSVGIAAGAPLAVPDPGCTASAIATGTVTVCLKEDHEGVTAVSFGGDHACDHITSRNTSLDYFIFVLPSAGTNPNRFFTGTPTVSYTTNGTTVLTTSGVIDASNPKFFAASLPAGATLLEAVALSNNGTSKPKGGEAQLFNLTHTCPASTTPPPPDTTPPTCKLTATVTGPPKSIQITVQDTGSGIGTVVATSSSNVLTAPTLPLEIKPATTAPILIVAQKIDQTKPSSIALEVTDAVGNSTVCDPVWKADRAAVARAAHRARVAALAARLR